MTLNLKLLIIFVNDTLNITCVYVVLFCCSLLLMLTLFFLALLLIYCHYVDSQILYLFFNYFYVILCTHANLLIGLCAVKLYVIKHELN